MTPVADIPAMSIDFAIDVSCSINITVENQGV
jgi:hypothetical protein